MKKSLLLIPAALLLFGAGCMGTQTTPPAQPAAPPAAPTTPTAPPQPTGFLPDATSTAQAFSTVPSNGDTNPYGVAFVPANFPSGGNLHPGDVLVSNFNSSKNLQGTGTTIVDISPAGAQSLFFQGKAGLGLTTALAALKNGFVMVGNLPTTDGTSSSTKAGSLLILNSKGELVTTLTDPNLVDGPWDMTVNDNGDAVQAYVSNALSGTVVRFDLVFNSTTLVSHTGTVIASGYTHRGDPAALVIGPTGLLYDASTDNLLVASTGDNAVYNIAGAGAATTSTGMGTIFYKDDAHLHGPLGLAKAPNGNFLVTNGDAINSDTTQPSELVEFTPTGTFVKELALDPSQGGAFGLAVDASPTMVRLAAVEDNTAQLLLWTASAAQ